MATNYERATIVPSILETSFKKYTSLKFRSDLWVASNQVKTPVFTGVPTKVGCEIHMTLVLNTIWWGAQEGFICQSGISNIYVWSDWNYIGWSHEVMGVKWGRWNTTMDTTIITKTVITAIWSYLRPGTSYSSCVPHIARLCASMQTHSNISKAL